ncbi:MAG: hypothetical protein H6753_03755 [Candidatus Omnitrophica bacterium]|nr:hypothetical protein [Candidatus Omnitrophota bacterium]
MKTESSGLENCVLFIEWLDIRSLFFDIIPCFMKQREKVSKTVFIFDASSIALSVARWLSFLLKWKIKIVRFELVDIQDQNHFSLRLRLDYFDLGIIQDKIVASRVFQNYIHHFKNEQFLGSYLAKDLLAFDHTSLNRHRQILHALTLINVSRWYLKGKEERIKLFLRQRDWAEVLREYACDFDVELIFVAAFQNTAFTLKKVLRQFFAKYIHWSIWGLRNLQFFLRKTSDANKLSTKRKFLGASRYQLAVEYYGHLNLDRMDTFSDLFFLQPSVLKGEDITLLFSLPQDPFDENKWQQLQKQHISALVRFPRASCLPQDKAPLHDPWSVPAAWHLSGRLPDREKESDDFEILRNKTIEYNRYFGYWKDLFQKGNIRLYTHWYKYDAGHIPLTDALRSLGGITTFYQRALETQSMRALAVVADVVFCYSPNNFAVEKENHSQIAHQVVTGFLGDFRFPYLKEKAVEIARPLRQKGVKCIIAFLDENTLDDGRWFTGHAFTQKNYSYLIEKVLQDSHYGIIFKPKSPGNLMRRLGPVAGMMEDLQRCGRAVILGGGSLQGMYPPVLASLAADLTIHECLSAGSAGVEAALAGASTLFLDTEGWPVSPFYQGGLGKVVFQDWNSMWQACVDFFEKPQAKASLGNCEPFLAAVDPFRDGQAAQRMGNYLKWLIDGLNCGLPRETVLADANERYARLWGKDKIHSI